MHATPTDIARKALADHLAALPAAELLKRYAARRDPEAFAGLVQQFGPMVLGVCARVLGRSADVDDAFQAVFLSLARQADSFRDSAALPAWLHRVALRVAHKALARREPASAPPDTVPDPADPFAEVAWKDVRRALDEELDALPDKYRGPVVLCWLDGLTQDEAARRLGTSLATLKRRLEAGRELLRARLVRRGLAPVLAASAVLDAAGLTASVPDALKVLAVELGMPGATAPVGVEQVIQLVPTAASRLLTVARPLAPAVGVVLAGLVLAYTVRPDRDDAARSDEPKPEAPRWQLTRVLSPSSDLFSRVAFSPDGRLLAYHLSDGQDSWEIWNLETGTKVYGLRRRVDERSVVNGRTFRFSADGRTFRTWYGTWDTAIWRQVEGLNPDVRQRWVEHFTLGFSRNGRWRVFHDVPTLNPSLVAAVGSGALAAAATSPALIERKWEAASWIGNQIQGRSVAVSDAETGEIVFRMPEPVWWDNVPLPDRGALGVHWRQWDWQITDDGRYLVGRTGSWRPPDPGRTSPVPLVTGRRDRVEIWDTRTGARVASYETGFYQFHLLLTPDGTRFVGMGFEVGKDLNSLPEPDLGRPKLGVWDLMSGQQVATMAGYLAENYEVLAGDADRWAEWGKSVALSPNGRTVATICATQPVSMNSLIRFWDVDGGPPVATLSSPVGAAGTFYGTGIAFGPDGKTVIVCGAEWQRDNGTPGKLKWKAIPGGRLEVLEFRSPLAP